MKVLLGSECAEMTVKGSRFIAEAIFTENQTDARCILKAQKEKYPSATHVCHAFIVGKNAEVCGMGDDGEPSGTAGRPMLEVLRGSGITNIIVTVTRYFGGTLLGTGGLVRAYSDSVKAVLSVCKTEELVEKSTFLVCVPYEAHSMVRHILLDFGISNLSEDFSQEVRITGTVHTARVEELSRMVKDATHGKSSVEWL